MAVAGSPKPVVPAAPSVLIEGAAELDPARTLELVMSRLPAGKDTIRAVVSNLQAGTENRLLMAILGSALDVIGACPDDSVIEASLLEPILVVDEETLGQLEASIPKPNTVRRHGDRHHYA